VAAQIDLFRAAQASRQKNATRTLKKFLDAGDIHLVEASAQEDSHAVATRIVGM
jgi:hypothetical protein